MFYDCFTSSGVNIDSTSTLILTLIGVVGVPQPHSVGNGNMDYHSTDGRRSLRSRYDRPSGISVRGRRPNHMSKLACQATNGSQVISELARGLDGTAGSSDVAMLYGSLMGDL